MTPREELEAAIARAGWRCVECGSELITAVPDQGAYIPEVAHWADLSGYVCPCLMAGSLAMILCWMDVLDALRAGGYRAADYGEPEPRHSMRSVMT